MKFVPCQVMTRATVRTSGIKTLKINLLEPSNVLRQRRAFIITEISK